MASHIDVYGDVIQRVIGEPLYGCEVGVWKGDFSEAILRRFNDLSMVLIDQYRQYGEPEKGLKCRMQKITQAEMYAAMQLAVDRTMPMSERRMVMVGTSEHAARLLGRDRFDFGFIDSNHGYKWVKHDVAAYYRTVRPGGLVGGHDYNGPADRRGRYGVKRAVDEFAEEHGYTVETESRRIWWFVKK